MKPIQPQRSPRATPRASRTEDAPCPRCGRFLSFPTAAERILCESCGVRWVRPLPSTHTLRIEQGGLRLTLGKREVGRIHRPRFPFQHALWEDPPVRWLRRRYPWLRRLAGKDEWARQVGLMRRLRLEEFPSRPTLPVLRKFGLETICRTNNSWFCTHYAYLYVVFAAAAGWTARIVNIGRDEENTHGHMVAEAWNNELQKWVLLDPLYAAWFSDKRNPREPLDSLEIRKGWLRKRGRNLLLHTRVIDQKEGPLSAERVMPAAAYHAGNGTLHPRGYFWGVAYLSNRFLTDPYEARDHLVLLWRDAWNRGRRWMHRGHPIGYYRERRLVETTDGRDFHPPLNNTVPWIIMEKGRTRVFLKTLGPSFARFESNAGNGWRPVRREFELVPTDLMSRLRFRTVNRFGIAGKSTTLSLSVKRL